MDENELYNPAQRMWERLTATYIASVNGNYELLDTHQREINQTINTAYFDELTGLPNRSYCMEVRGDIAKKNKSAVCVFLDLNHLKRINDNYGHEAGDFLLKYFSKRLKALMKKEFVVSRIGGDEFVIFSLEEEQLAEKEINRLKKVLNSENPFSREVQLAEFGSIKFTDEKLQSTAFEFAYGIATRDVENNEDSEVWMKRADLIMYNNKLKEKGLAMSDKFAFTYNRMLNKEGEFSPGYKSTKTIDGEINRTGSRII